MADAFLKFCLAEESLFSIVLCCIYARYPDRAESFEAAASVLAFLAAATVANVAIYAENRGLQWSKLNLGRKACQVLEAVATAFLASCTAFSVLGLASGHAMGPCALVTLSAMAGFDLGILGVVGFYVTENVARDGAAWVEAVRVLKKLRGRKGNKMKDRTACRFSLERLEPNGSGLPDELALVMADIDEDGGKEAVEAAIGILREEVARLASVTNVEGERDKVRVAAWVDYFIMHCMVEEDEGYLELWEENAEIIAKLLIETERLLLELPSEFGTRPADCKTRGLYEDLAGISQRLNAYLCIAAGFAEDGGEFEVRLHRALNSTEANVDCLLSHWSAEDLARLEHIERPGSYEPGTRYWTEPLALLAYAAAIIRKSREVRRAYERYIGHLEKSGADPEGVRAHLLLDAELTLGNLLGTSIEEIYPDYPLDFGATGSIRKLVSEHPDLPIVVFAGPEGTHGAYCDIKGVEVVELLNRKTSYYNVANAATSREELVASIAQDIKDFGCVEGFDEDWTDEQITQAARREALRFKDDWVPAIAIRVSWKDV